MWVRGYAQNSGADSLHVGLAGVALSSGKSIKGFNSDKAWVSENTNASGTPASIDVPSTGTHAFNIWMREDGFIGDMLLLTQDTELVPTGFGDGL